MSSREIYAADPAKGWRPWGLLVPVLAIGFVAITVIVLQIVLQHLHLLDAKENPIGLLGFAAFLIGPFGALALVVLAWVRFVERRPFSTIGLRPGHAARTFIAGHLIGVAMMVTIVLGIWLAGGLVSGAAAPAWRDPAGLAGIAILLLCFCVQSSTEEILFRGWMLSAMAAKFGVTAAIAISSLVFALLHFDPTAPWLFYVNVVLFAVFASLWALRSGNIWGIMGWHSGWNWLLAVGFELRVTGLDAHMPALLVKLMPIGPVWLTGGDQGSEGSVFCTAVLVCGIAFQALRKSRPADFSTPDSQPVATPAL